MQRLAVGKPPPPLDVTPAVGRVAAEAEAAPSRGLRFLDGESEVAC